MLLQVHPFQAIVLTAMDSEIIAGEDGGRALDNAVTDSSPLNKQHWASKIYRGYAQPKCRAVVGAGNGHMARRIWKKIGTVISPVVVVASFFKFWLCISLAQYWLLPPERNGARRPITDPQIPLAALGSARDKVMPCCKA